MVGDSASVLHGCPYSGEEFVSVIDIDWGLWDYWPPKIGSALPQHFGPTRGNLHYGVEELFAGVDLTDVEFLEESAVGVVQEDGIGE